MARKTRGSQLETRASRDRLPVDGKIHYRHIDKTLSVGYRKTTGEQRSTSKSGGTWYVRLRLPDKRYRVESLGMADDFRDANELDVLSYDQAQAKARQFADEYAEKLNKPEPYTVKTAAADYMDWFETEGKKSIAETQRVIDRNILPKFGDCVLDELTADDIRDWRDSISKSHPEGRNGKPLNRPLDPRAAEARANRILTVFKAILNKAYENRKLSNDDEWRSVKAFKNVNAPRIRFLTDDEVRRLVNAADGDFRSLLIAGIQTDCRYGELIVLKVQHVDLTVGSIHIIDSKSCNPRDVPLTDEGQAFFERVIIGKGSDDFVFIRADGLNWSRSDQVRRMVLTSERANVTPPASFHVLRQRFSF